MVAVDANPSPDLKRVVVNLEKPHCPSKRRREAADKSASSSAFRKEEFVNARMEEFRSDPILFVINTLKHYGDWQKSELETAEARVRGALKEKELVVKERVTATSKRDEAIKKLEPTSKTLARVRNKLSELKEEKGKLDEARGSDAEEMKKWKERALKAEEEAKRLKEATENAPDLEKELEQTKKELAAEREERMTVCAELDRVDEISP